MSEHDQQAASTTQQALEQAIKTIQTPEHADRVIDELERMAANVTVAQVGQQTAPAASAQDAANQIAQATEVPPSEQPQAVITEIATQIAAAEQPEQAALSAGVQQATNPELGNLYKPETASERRLLQEALLRRMNRLQRLDSSIFLAINNLPHPQLANDFFFLLTTIFNRGDAWLAGLIVAALRDPRQRKVILDVLPALWMTSGVVEGPVKQVFRRQRPFVSVVRAIVVGKKPGNYSFPSGHSAAAFAGAYLLARHYPRRTPLFYTIATLVAFSRVYLGAHYPGDVVSGAVVGTVLADVFRRLTSEIAEAID